MVRVLLEHAKPVMNTILGQSLITLGGEGVGAGLIATSMLQIGIEGATSFIQKIDITKFSTLMTDVQPADFGPICVCSMRRYETSLTRQPAQ